MKFCRCCRQKWPLEFYAARGQGRRARCQACRANCGAARRRQRVERTRAYRARLRAEVSWSRAHRAAHFVEPFTPVRSYGLEAVAEGAL